MSSQLLYIPKNSYKTWAIWLKSSITRDVTLHTSHCSNLDHSFKQPQTNRRPLPLHNQAMTTQRRGWSTSFSKKCFLGKCVHPHNTTVVHLPDLWVALWRCHRQTPAVKKRNSAIKPTKRLRCSSAGDCVRSSQSECSQQLRCRVVQQRLWRRLDWICSITCQFSRHRAARSDEKLHTDQHREVQQDASNRRGYKDEEINKVIN